MTSLRNHLLVLLLGAVFLAGTASLAITYVGLASEVDDLFDEHMINLAEALRSRGEHGLERPMPVLGQLPGESPDDDEFVVSVFDTGGQLVAISRPELQFPLVVNEGFATVRWRDEDWRVYATQVPNRTLQVSQRLAARKEVLFDIAFHILLPVVATIPLQAALVWWVVGNALRPLRSIASAVRSRSSRSLEPLVLPRAPSEIWPLIDSINDLLARLGRSFENQRNLVVDAAHELRTPLAAISLQEQLLQRLESGAERTEALVRMRAGLNRATHVVSQLLILARQEPETSREPAVPVQLEALVKMALHEHAPRAQAKQIDLGLVREEPVALTGEPDSLRILINNLLDNAINYTPHGGRVDVSVLHLGHQAALLISDNGPGIPTEARARVFDRFYRVPGVGEPGSGLGLAIVKRIADRHRASVHVTDGLDGRGLTIAVQFEIERPGVPGLPKNSGSA